MRINCDLNKQHLDLMHNENYFIKMVIGEHEEDGFTNDKIGKFTMFCF